MIEIKSSEIAAITERQKETQNKLNRISAQLETLNVQIETANQSYKSLMTKVENIDKKKSNYTEEVRKIRDANKESKEFLDRKLPDDFKRLLNDAVHE